MILAVSTSLASQIICFWIPESRKEISGNYKTLDPVDDGPFELAQLLLFVPLQWHELTAKVASLLREGWEEHLLTAPVRSTEMGRNWIMSSQSIGEVGFATQMVLGANQGS